MGKKHIVELDTFTYGNGANYKSVIIDDIKFPEMTSYISFYAIINGKCAWCGKDAKRLKTSHYEKHEKEDKQQKDQR